MSEHTTPTITSAEDDYDDRLLIRDALLEAGLGDRIVFVNDGVELLESLHRRGKYQAMPHHRPDFILLDLKMPRKNGWETLEEIRRDPHLQDLPVFILTTSTDEEDQQHAHRLGADGYFTKQVSFDKLVDELSRIGAAWKKIVRQRRSNM